jgi:hypothetical protein
MRVREINLRRQMRDMLDQMPHFYFEELAGAGLCGIFPGAS